MSEPIWVCPNDPLHYVDGRVETKDLFMVGSVFPVSVPTGIVQYCRMCKCDAVPLTQDEWLSRVTKEPR